MFALCSNLINSFIILSNPTIFFCNSLILFSVTTITKQLPLYKICHQFTNLGKIVESLPSLVDSFSVGLRFLDCVSFKYSMALLIISALVIFIVDNLESGRSWLSSLNRSLNLSLRSFSYLRFFLQRKQMSFRIPEDYQLTMTLPYLLRTLFATHEDVVLLIHRLTDSCEYNISFEIFGLKSFRRKFLRWRGILKENAIELGQNVHLNTIEVVIITWLLRFC